MVRAGTSPGFGHRLAFPVSQWRLSRGSIPLTVAGPRRIHTGFRRPHSRDQLSAVSCQLLLLECGSALFVIGAFSFARLSLGLELGVQQGDLGG